MQNIKAASRYAKAILELAIESKKMDEVHNDMVSIQQTVADSKELRRLLVSPIVKSDKKASVLKALFEKGFTDISTKYIDLLASKGREALIPAVASQFIIKYNENKNIVKAEVISAVKLDASQKKKVLDLVKHDGEVQLTEKIDPSLIGGFIVKVGDKQIDASIARKFQNLRKEIILN